MENQAPLKDGKLPLIEEPEPKTLSKDQYKQAQAAAVAAAAAEMRSLIFRMKLERGNSKGEASTSATKSDEAAAGTQPKVPFPWPA